MPSPAQRSVNASVAALARIRQGRTNVQASHDAFERRFVNQVLAEAAQRGEADLSPEVVRRRAEAARKEHFKRMAAASLRTREAEKARKRAS
jgi:hypothetical protein